MKKTILVIEEDDLLRTYLSKKLDRYGFEVTNAKTGFDGQLKLKSLRPDLLIMEYHLSRVNGPELLEDKAATRAVADVPVILFADQADKEKVLAVAKYKIARFFPKPLRIDTLLKSISELLGVPIAFDETPCISDVRMNEQVLFVEVAGGLNWEKIELIGYKCRELMGLYAVRDPRIIILMTDITIAPGDGPKLEIFFATVLESTASPPWTIKVLTTSAQVKEFIARNERYRGIETPSSLADAMEKLLGEQSLAPKTGAAGSLHVNFAADKGITIAVVDDDVVTRELVASAFRQSGCDVALFENGKLFVDALPGGKFDLVFLDLRMPVMDGFGVLAHMQGVQSKVPVIILSSLSQRETVVKAMGFGIRSYLAKPLTPEEIQRKAVEILKTNF